MLDKLKAIVKRFEEIEEQLASPEIIAKQSVYQKLGKEHSNLTPLVTSVRSMFAVKEELENLDTLMRSEEAGFRELAREEMTKLREELSLLEETIKVLLLPKDPNDEKNVLLEIRAGTGGEEASLFASDLFRMYSRYAERNSWKIELLSHTASSVPGGIKEVIAEIAGSGAYSKLKFESGVHRVQRVPATEAQGRIHTSAVTVAILPEAEEIDVSIEPNELRIDVFHASGHGGQSVNTTDSAVRITHLPTGMIVSCQDEKSQLKNKNKAMKVLRSRLLDIKTQEQNAKIASERKSQVGSGDRSERIRTYNFPQGRMTDHRITLTLYSLDKFLDGEIQEVIDALTAHFQAELIKQNSDNIAS
ncbi:MAG: peptide chain release factor 1 [Deltaproteobacteria bacterium]|nr:peptide chain release factor 1 [Deltaproteobacteria bacterium]